MLFIGSLPSRKLRAVHEGEAVYLFPELSNSGIPPAEPGVTLD